MIKRCVVFLLFTLLLDARMALGDPVFTYQFILPEGYSVGYNTTYDAADPCASTYSDSSNDDSSCNLATAENSYNYALCQNEDDVACWSGSTDPGPLRFNLSWDNNEAIILFDTNSNMTLISNVTARPYDTSICINTGTLTTEDSYISYQDDQDGNSICQIVFTDRDEFVYTLSSDEGTITDTDAGTADVCDEASPCTLDADNSIQYSLSSDSKPTENFEISYGTTDYTATFSSDLPCPTIKDETTCTLYNSNACQFYNTIEGEPCELEVVGYHDFTYTLSSTDGSITDNPCPEGSPCTLDNTGKGDADYYYKACNTGDPQEFNIALIEDGEAIVTLYDDLTCPTLPDSSNDSCSVDDTTCTFTSTDGGTCDIVINNSVDDDTLPCPIVLSGCKTATQTILPAQCTDEIDYSPYLNYCTGLTVTYMDFQNATTSTCSRIIDTEQTVYSLIEDLNGDGATCPYAWPTEAPVPCQ